MSRIFALATIAVAIPGCVAFGHGDDADDDGGYQETCHIDCFGGAECVGDQLHVAGLGARPIDCEQGYQPFFCDVQVTTCPLGCLGDRIFTMENGDHLDYAQYDWLCRSATPANAGDTCATDDDCRPTFAVPAVENQVTQTYLRCGAAGICEAAPPPEIAGYGAACTPGPDAGWSVRWIEGAAPGEVCLYGRAAVDACVRTFATRTCDGDWECPQGSRCDDHVTHADGTITDGLGICHPGATLRSAELPCTASGV